MHHHPRPRLLFEVLGAGLLLARPRCRHFGCWWLACAARPGAGPLTCGVSALGWAQLTAHSHCCPLLLLLVTSLASLCCLASPLPLLLLLLLLLVLLVAAVLLSLLPPPAALLARVKLRVRVTQVSRWLSRPWRGPPRPSARPTVPHCTALYWSAVSPQATCLYNWLPVPPPTTPQALRSVFQTVAAVPEVRMSVASALNVN